MSRQGRYQSTTSSYGVSLLFIFCVVMEVEASRENLIVGVKVGTLTLCLLVFILLFYYCLLRLSVQAVIDVGAGGVDRGVDVGVDVGGVDLEAEVQADAGDVDFESGIGSAEGDLEDGVIINADAGNVYYVADAANVDLYADAGNVD
ncbi:uncharacterized protein LOC135806886 isoform X2 [Sycon ciliatum]|uniref:uncharacterized protein LOC135806886 isoform X2 n=1 Tax=Sycon ciliatum TaxID=27933 RepID=UPI0031F6ADC5